MRKLPWPVMVALALLGGMLLACANGAATPAATLSAPPALTPTAPAATATSMPPTGTSQPALTATPLAPGTATVTIAPSPAPATAESTFDSRLLGRLERNVTYCTVDGVELKMDVQYPATGGEPAPVVVFIHGGGWSEGDKAGTAKMAYNPALRATNFVLISLNYRLAPEFKFPAQIEDVKCAIRHLRANASRYNVDPAHIGVWGDSAGGHLSALIGLADESAGWDVGQYTDQSSAAQAVAVCFPATDFTKEFTGINEVGADVFGFTDPNDPLRLIYSPIHYVSASDPPFLLIHGAQDHFVPPEQSQELYDLLVAAGVPAELLLVKNMGHAFSQVGGELDPSLDELRQIVADYFVKQLGQ